MVYDVDPDTYELLEAKHYWTNLTAEGYQDGPVWSEYFSARNDYAPLLEGPPLKPHEALTPAYWHRVTEALERNTTAFLEFHKRMTTGWQGPRAKPCVGLCKDRWINQLRSASADYLHEKPPDPDTGGFILWTPSQGPHAYQAAVCASTGIEKERLRVVSTATGGGFGARIACYPEQIVVVALARELGRPVRYVETRSETMLGMQHGRAQVQDVTIGGTRDGKITGLKVRVIADCGAYPADASLMPMLTGLMSCGVYEIPKVERISVDEVYARSPKQMKECENRDDLFLTVIVVPFG